MITWPHVMVFDCCMTAMLEDMPFTFKWNNKKFVLRSALLGNNSHFIALICTPEAWLHYDGLKDIKFCFYNSQHTVTVRGEYGLDKVLYEVLNEDDTRDFGSTDISWEDVLVCDTNKFSKTFLKQAGKIAKEINTTDYKKTDTILLQRESSNKKK